MRYAILVRSRWPWLLFRTWRLRFLLLSAFTTEQMERWAVKKYGFDNVLTYRNLHVKV